MTSSDDFDQVFLPSGTPDRRAEPEVVWRLGEPAPKPWRISSASRLALWSEVVAELDPLPHLAAAVKAHVLGREAEALAACDAALDLDPDNRFALCLRGAARLATGAYADAERDYDRAAARWPDAAGPYLGRGTARRRLGRRREALEDVAAAKARAAGPTVQAHVRLLHGAILLDAAEPEAALDEFNAALALAPSFFEAWIGRAQAWLALYQPERARADAARARRLEPDAVLLENGFTPQVVKVALM